MFGDWYGDAQGTAAFYRARKESGDEVEDAETGQRYLYPKKVLMRVKEDEEDIDRFLKHVRISQSRSPRWKTPSTTPDDK